MSVICSFHSSIVLLTFLDKKNDVPKPVIIDSESTEEYEYAPRAAPFLRFGRSQPTFLRFGRSQPTFLRFGRQNQEINSNQFLRFGKKGEFLRFG